MNHRNTRSNAYSFHVRLVKIVLVLSTFYFFSYYLSYLYHQILVYFLPSVSHLLYSLKTATFGSCFQMEILLLYFAGALWGEKNKHREIKAPKRGKHIEVDTKSKVRDEIWTDGLVLVWQWEREADFCWFIWSKKIIWVVELRGLELYRAHIYWVREISPPYFELIDSIPKAQCCQMLELYNQKEK